MGRTTGAAVLTPLNWTTDKPTQPGVLTFARILARRAGNQLHFHRFSFLERSDG